jgi:hypothetical protein
MRDDAAARSHQVAARIKRFDAVAAQHRQQRPDRTIENLFRFERSRRARFRASPGLKQLKPVDGRNDERNRDDSWTHRNDAATRHASRQAVRGVVDPRSRVSSCPMKTPEQKTVVLAPPDACTCDALVGASQQHQLITCEGRAGILAIGDFDRQKSRESHRRKPLR